MAAAIDLDQVRTSMHIRPGSRVENRFDSLATEVLAEFDELVEMGSCWRFVDNRHAGLPAGLARFRSLAMVAITAGQALSERLSLLSRQRRLFHAAILDAMANQAIDTRTAAIDAELRASAHRAGFFLSRRYSPGCPQLPMTQLSVIIAALEATERIGVGCTPAPMLTPIKSVAYLHGADPGLLADQPVDFCDTCRRTGCPRSRRNRDHS